MKFVFAHKKLERPLYFRDVHEDQMFVNSDGCLCQKINSDSFCTIANDTGALYATYVNDVKSTEVIRRIITDLVKIEY